MLPQIRKFEKNKFNDIKKNQQKKLKTSIKLMPFYQFFQVLSIFFIDCNLIGTPSNVFSMGLSIFLFTVSLQINLILNMLQISQLLHKILYILVSFFIRSPCHRPIPIIKAPKIFQSTIKPTNSSWLFFWAWLPLTRSSHLFLVFCKCFWTNSA